MPVQVSFPGVYIQEVPSGVHTITGVSTSIAAFFGRASKGKMNKAIRVLSYSDYVRTFGDPYPGADLANSVRLFFANGGTDCYVVRLAQGAHKASVTLLGTDTQPVLNAVAKAEGRWADTVRLEVNYNTTNPDETFNLRVIQEESGVPVASESFPNLSMDPSSPRFAPSFVTQGSDLIELTADPSVVPKLANLGDSFAGFSQGRRPLGGTAGNVNTFLDTQINATAPNFNSSFDISVNGSPFVNVNLRPYVSPGTINQNNIQGILAGRINAALSELSPAPTVTVDLSTASATVGRLIRITASNGDSSSVRVRSAATNDIAAVLMLGVDQGGIEPVRWSNFRPVPTATFLPLGALNTPGDISNITNLADFQQNSMASLTLDGQAIAFTGDFSLQTTAAPTDRWFQSAPIAGSLNGDNDGIREKLKIIAAAINATARLPYRAEVWGYHLAIIARGGPFNQLPAITVTPSPDPTTDQLLNALVGARNGRQYTLGISGVGQFSAAGAAGDDGNAPTAGDYMGNPVTQTGFYALDTVDLFNLMVIPADEGVTEATHLNLWGPASNYCADHRAFLLIDAPASWTQNSRPKVVEDTSKIDNDIRKKVVKINSAVFYPRLNYTDNGLVKLIGPAGPIAGLMARIDSSRGVWKAAAGTEADLRGIVGLEVNLTDPENGVLNKLGVDCIRSFPAGFVSWGARTMDGSDDFGSEWKYIPIRRLALFLEESLFRGTKWVVFEPNDEPLWSKIRLNLNAFMMSLFRQGAFQGSTPDKAFFVKCDAETTTQNDRNLGIVNIIVGFAPLKPAEFVIIKIQQIAGDL